MSAPSTPLPWALITPVQPGSAPARIVNIEGRVVAFVPDPTDGLHIVKCVDRREKIVRSLRSLTNAVFVVGQAPGPATADEEIMFDVALDARDVLAEAES